MTTLSEALREARAQLPGDEAATEAELLLAQALAKPRSWLYAHGGDELEPEARRRFADLLARRRHGEPVAHLLGRRDFWTLELAVDAHTLVPRPETELLVELALARVDAGTEARILDLGTGSGAIALALASERPRARVTAVDASADALAVAARNAARLGLDRVRCLRSDWYSAVADEVFDLVVSNPPYLAGDDPHLGQGDLPFEPRSALVAGVDGLDDLRRIVADAPPRLSAGGWLLVEHGWGQGAAVRSLFERADFQQIETCRDLEQRDRVTLGRRG